MDLTMKEMKEILYMYMTRNKPFMMHGAPGIGKSDSVRQVAAKIAAEKNKEFSDDEYDPDKFSLLDIRISQMDPSDLKGIPFPDGAVAKWLPPNYLPPEGEGVMFFDEINLAPPSIQAACYQLILNRRLGDYVLPKGWTIVAAGNRTEDKANIYPMSMPLKNRFSHATLMPPGDDEWIDWALENDIRTDIISFIKFKPGYLHKMNAKSNDNAWPSHRMWAVASHVTKEVTNLEKEYKLIASCVGEGAATEYHGFVKLKRKINIADILKNPKSVADITQPDLLYSLVSGLAEKYKQDKKKMDEILAVIDHLSDEFGVFLLRMMKAFNQKTFVNDLMAAKSWKKLYSRFGKFIL